MDRTPFAFSGAESMESVRSRATRKSPNKSKQEEEAAANPFFDILRLLILLSVSFGLASLSSVISKQDIPLIWPANGVHVAALLVTTSKIRLLVPVAFIGTVFAALVTAGNFPLLLAAEMAGIHGLESIMMALVLFAATMLKQNLSESKSLFTFIFSSAIVLLVFSICRSLIFVLPGNLDSPSDITLAQRILLDWSAGFPGLLIIIPMFSYLRISEIDKLKDLFYNKNTIICVVGPLGTSFLAALLPWILQVYIGHGSWFLSLYCHYALVFSAGYFGGTFGLCLTSLSGLLSNLGYSFVWRKESTSSLSITLGEGHLPVLHIHALLQITALVFVFLVLKKDTKYAKALKKFDSKIKNLSGDLDMARRENEIQRQELAVKTAYIPFLCKQFHGPAISVMTLWENAREDSRFAESLQLAESMMEPMGVILSLIDDVLSYSQLEEGILKLMPVPTDLQKVIFSTMEIVGGLFSQSNIVLEHELSNIPEIVVIDPIRFEQTLLNILTTACQYTNPGGKITLKVTGTSDNIMQVSDPPFNIDVMVTFGETGTFVPVETIFNPFNMKPIRGITTTSSSPDINSFIIESGLGMATAKKIVELMGGGSTIQATRASPHLGGSTKISFMIQVLLKQPSSSPTENQGDDASGKGTFKHVITTLSRRISRATNNSSAKDGNESQVSSAKTTDFFKSVASLTLRGGGTSGRSTNNSPPGLNDRPLNHSFSIDGGKRGFSVSQSSPLSPAPDFGSQFDLKFPTMASTSTKVGTASAATGCSGNVLIVDDSSVFRQVLKKMLMSYDSLIKVHEAANGAEAIMVGQRNSLDLIFLDLEMPKMNGEEALSKLRQSDPHCPIIILTSHNISSEFVEKLKRQGMSQYIQKPVSKETTQSIMKHHYVPRRKSIHMGIADSSEVGGARESTPGSSPLTPTLSQYEKSKNSNSAMTRTDTTGTRPSASSTLRGKMPQRTSSRKTIDTVKIVFDNQSSSEQLNQQGYPNTSLDGFVPTPPSQSGQNSMNGSHLSFPPTVATVSEIFSKFIALVVDDSLMNRAILTKILEKFGKFHEIVEVASGHEAIKVCQQKKVCIIFMDLEMPGMSG
ncbi:hypothetical protein BDR26DRAFT_29192 [Obelidium mucronatum]|nr:hypothetical protein BDR26DRAFT_29192 [Obelidium mucronatum]